VLRRFFIASPGYCTREAIENAGLDIKAIAAVHRQCRLWVDAVEKVTNCPSSIFLL
jgi:hypothetical protein